MKLFGSIDSGHSFKPRSFLLLTGIPHDYYGVDLALARSARPANFVSVSKFGEVPVLVHGEQAMCQSNAILIYLAQKTRLYCGHDAAEWQSILEWLNWESNRIGFSIPNLRYALRWAPQAPEVLVYLRDRAMADLLTLDGVFAESEFLLPSGVTIADLSCSAYLFWLSQAGIDEAAFPNIQRWLSSIRALPGWVHPDIALLATSS
ncbi:glutathione S-transferase family protein [Undibacterium sp. Di27W]|uniref:glutathione S-transferase family protein n=1 Tax=Undibacterium sp. Di27W TaxID=3413036 RepID=UPI003BF0C400